MKPIAFAMAAAFTLAAVPAFWRIASKAGYRPALALLAPISPLNLIMLWVFALREWPIERELRLAQEHPTEPAA